MKILTNKQTKTQGENIITSLSRVIIVYVQHAQNLRRDVSVSFSKKNHRRNTNVTVSYYRGNGKRWLPRTPFWYTITLFIVRPHKVSKPRDLYLELYDRRSRGVSQISRQCDNLNYQSRGFGISRDLTIGRLIEYWNGTLIFVNRCIITNNCLSLEHSQTAYDYGSTESLLTTMQIHVSWITLLYLYISHNIPTYPAAAWRKNNRCTYLYTLNPFNKLKLGQNGHRSAGDIFE